MAKFIFVMQHQPTPEQLSAATEGGREVVQLADKKLLVVPDDAGLGRDWFVQRPNACIMSAHAKIDITPQTAREWLSAMDRAMGETGIAAQPRAMISEAFARMAQGMAMR